MPLSDGQDQFLADGPRAPMPVGLPHRRTCDSRVMSPFYRSSYTCSLGDVPYVRTVLTSHRDVPFHRVSHRLADQMQTRIERYSAVFDVSQQWSRVSRKKWSAT